MDRATLTPIEQNTPQQRFEVMCKMTDYVRGVVRRVLAVEHPDWSEKQFQEAMVRIFCVDDRDETRDEVHKIIPHEDLQRLFLYQ